MISTSAPSRANAIATARPMPESPPVMTAFLPAQPAAAAVAVLAVVGLRTSISPVRPGCSIVRRRCPGRGVLLGRVLLGGLVLAHALVPR